LHVLQKDLSHSGAVALSLSILQPHCQCGPEPVELEGNCIVPLSTEIWSVCPPWGRRKKERKERKKRKTPQAARSSSHQLRKRGHLGRKPPSPEKKKIVSEDQEGCGQTSQQTSSNWFEGEENAQENVRSEQAYEHGAQNEHEA